MATKVAARLATARQAGDHSALVTPEAAADAFALLREAAPAPGQEVDDAALADICLTFFLRGLASGEAGGPDLVAAGLVGGLLFERAPRLLPGELRDHLASHDDPLREGRFAYLAATAHADAVTSETEETGRREAIGDATEGAEGTEGADLAALDRALAWSSVACEAAASRGDAVEAADAMVQRMGLRTARFQLAADLDALAEAARDGLTVSRQLSPERPDHVAYLLSATETVVRSAVLLGSPSVDEAERVVAALPPGSATEATTELLSMLRTLHAEPVTWPGELDARAGVVLTEQGGRAEHAGLLAAAVHRLRAALAGTSRDHPNHAALSNVLGAALLGFGEQRGDAGAFREGLTLLGEGGRLFRLLADQLSGPGVPAETGAAAAILDLVTGAAAAGGARELAVTSEWRTEFAAAVERLPARHPHQLVYATLLAALTNDPDQAETAVVTAATNIEWTRLAAELRAAGQSNQPALALADGFEAVAGTMAKVREFATVLEGIGDLGRDDDEPDVRIEQVKKMLAEAGGGGDALSADMRASLSGLLMLLTAQRGGAPAAFREAVQAVAWSQREANDPDIASGVTRSLGFALALPMLTDPAQVLTSLQTWDQETRLALAAMLAARPQHGGGIEDASAAFGEMLIAGMTFSAESEVSQLDKFRDAGQRIIGMIGQRDPVLEEQMTLLLDAVLTVGTGMRQTLEAIPQNQAAESNAGTIAELKRRIDELSQEHPARRILEQHLTILLGGQAFYLRETDPDQARELLAEATALADLEGSVDPIATILGQHLGSVRATLEQTKPPPHPGLRPGTSRQEVGDRLHRAGNTPEAIREVLGDEELPVWLRVNVGFSTAFQLIADLRIEASMDCAEQAMDLIADITDRGIDSEAAEHSIASLIGGLPSSYVSGVLGMLHAASNRQTQTGALVDRAAVLAERSRGLLLGRQLEGRTDLGELRSAHPELAEKFEALTNELAADPDTLTRLRPGDQPPACGRAEWVRLVKFRASRDLNALITGIREEDPEFRDFLRPLTAAQLRELAVYGPVVMFNHPLMPPEHQSDTPVTPFALVVTGQTITSVRLEIQPAEAAEVARRWTEAIATINSRGAERPGPNDLRRAGEELTKILSWTMHHVTGPILAAAGLPARTSGEADDADRSRIWWIPDGPFHALPLHAAQCPRSGCEFGGPDRAGCGAALDTVVSSYVPGFRILAHARRHAAGADADAGSALVVAVTDVELPGAETAAREASRQLGAGQPLIGPAATRTVVIEALADTRVAHFGCHAASDPVEPSGGRLYLPGGEPLTVHEICRARPRAARLAFLTACSTARTSQRLASEAIHLSSAFLVAGFSEAVGTLWEIDSQDAYRVTTEFYRRITGERPQDGAVALHHCVRALRRERPDDPHIWSAYVHAGTEARKTPVHRRWSCSIGLAS